MHWPLMSREAVNHVHISVPNIRKKMFFEAVSALLGLPSASMFLLGIHECLLCSEVLNVETQHTGEDLAQGVGFWYAFLTSFWGAKTMVLSKREGLLPGPGLALSFWFPFFLELWLLYFLLSWCFFGRYLGCNSVPGQGLDSCVVVWLSFLLLFWLALSLLSWSLFCSLLLCSWVPGTRVGSLRGRFSSC